MEPFPILKEITMRKSIIKSGGQDATTPEEKWLDLNRLARVEITSEDPRYPIEGALELGQSSGWLSNDPGLQTVRLRFDEPQRIRRIWLHFTEQRVARTQEFILRWGTADGQPTREIVRQQWIFHPKGSTHETEDYRVDLYAVSLLELMISPDISGGEALASLMEMRVA
jgi:hypothetical protein